MVLLYDVSHLSNFSYHVGNVLVRFSYTNHVFTDGSASPTTPSHLFIDDRGNKRAFNDQRFHDSILLPTHLRHLAQSKIYNETHGNAFYFPKGGTIYRIILSMKREKKDVAVRVESAHRVATTPNFKKDLSMNFPVAIKRTYENKPLFPNKK